MRRPMPIAAAACLLALIAGSGRMATPAPPDAFGPPLARLDLDLAALGAAGVGGQVQLALLDDLDITVNVTRLHGDEQGDLHLAGDIVDADPPGRFNLVVRHGAVSGLVRLPGHGVYRIHGTHPGAVTLHEIDELQLPPCIVGGEHVRGVPRVPGGAMAVGGVPCDDGSVIDVLVLYTIVARESIGSVLAMESQIDLAIDLANEAYDNSLIPMNINLVHTEELIYFESGGYSGHLNRLTNPNDGFMDVAHELRDEYAADMVALLVDDGAACGVAWLMNDNSPAWEDSAFSVTTWYCVSGHTFAHELGHNMGCCHAVGDGGGCVAGGLFNYSVGWRFDGAGGPLWRTVMAYSPGIRITHFSDPDISFDATPTGVPIGDPGEANNAFTIRQTHGTISQFRCSLPVCEEGLVLAADGEADDAFGTEVALDGDVAVITAPGEDDNGLGAGAAYVYRNDGSPSWAQETKLTATDGAAGDGFGLDVAISGDVIVVGASEDDDDGSESGSAYVYRYNGASWTQEQRLAANDASAGARFGASVAIDGDLIAVGADAESESAPDAGAVYVFRYDGASWIQEQKLLAADGAEDDAFGTAVAVSGDALLAGAVGHDVGGSAYVFRFDGASWNQEDEMTPTDLGTGDRYGHALGLDGDRALVGAYLHDAGAVDAGAVYPYEFDGASWVEQIKIQALDPVANASFGRSLDLAGAVAIIGAYGVDDFGVNSGAVYVFATDGTWDQQAKLYASDPQPGDRFGFATAIDDSFALVGTLSADAVASGAGAAEIFAGPVYDCNNNGFADACDIFYEPFLDLDGDGVLDACVCPWDLDGDGVVATADLLALLGAWLSDPGGPPDFNGNGFVGTIDLLFLLGNWGPCPS